MSARQGFTSSMVSGCCPRCRKGKVFTHSFYNLSKYSSVYPNCPECGIKFETEPGFFWGAMYFAYALNVGVAVISGLVLLIFFNDPELWVYISVIVPLMIVLTPVMLRFSRLLMMYVAAPYRKFDRNASGS